MDRRFGAIIRFVNMRRATFFFLAAFIACSSQQTTAPATAEPFILVLGTAQDAGFPQAGCRQAECVRARTNPSLQRFVASIAIVDPRSGERWIIDATPDFPQQLALLDRLAPARSNRDVTAIFLTHAHIGHYTGLVHFGREVMGSKRVPVFVMPRMDHFLRNNGPWQQLVELENISLQPLADGQPVRLNERLAITPILVPHRDEYSETVGFVVTGPSRSVLYLPDIDKWERWTSIDAILSTVDDALLDGTFYADGELPGRSMSEIPHPFIVESLQRFAQKTAFTRAKIHFIHLNHSNPALDPASEARRNIERAGHRVAEQGARVPL